MALELTTTTKNLSRQTNIEPVIIIDIDGLPVIFGSGSIERKWGLDEDYNIDSGLFVDGVVEDENSRDWVSLDGTTTNITSQVIIEEGGSGSVQKFKARITDVGGAVTDYMTPGNYIDDPLANEVDVYIGFRGGSHPEDSVRIFNGIIDAVTPNASSIDISISHPDELKRQRIFEQKTAQVSEPISADSEVFTFINSTVTTIPVNDATDFLDPPAGYNAYVKISDEIIQYTGKSGNSLTGCTRGARNTTANSHSGGTVIESNYITDETSTVIYLDDTSVLIDAFDTVKTYIQINDEITEYNPAAQ